MPTNPHRAHPDDVSPFHRWALSVVMALLLLRLIAGAVPPDVPLSLAAPVTAVLLAVLVLFILLDGRIRKAHIGLLLSLGGMLFVSVFSFMLTDPLQKQDAYLFLLRIILLIVWVGFAGVYLTSKTGLVIFTSFVRTALYFGAILAIVQVSLFPELYSIRGDTRAFGMMGHPVPFCMFLFISITFIEFSRVRLGQLRSASDKGAIIAGLVAMVLTQSQTAWIMFAIYTIFLIRSRRSTLVKVIATPVLLGIMLGILYAIPFTRDLFSFFEVFRYFGEIPVDRYAHWLVNDSVSWRVVNWKMSVSTMLPQWYIGLGPGQAEIHNYFGLTLHSLPLEVFVEIGAFGLLFLLAMMRRTYLLLRRKRTDSPQEQHARRIVQGAAIATLGAAVLSVTMVDQMLYHLVFFTMVVITAIPVQEMASEQPDQGR